MIDHVTGSPHTPDLDRAAATAEISTLRRQAIRGGTLFLSSRLVVQALQWLATLLVARMLAPADYGMMATVLLFIGLADLLAEAGLGRALMQKQSITATDQAQAFTLSMILAIALYALLWVSSEPLGAHFASSELSMLLRVTALVVLLVPFQAIASSLLERDLKYGQQSTVHFSMAALQSVIVLGLAWAEYGVWALAIGLIAARVFQSGLLLWFSGWRPAFAIPSAVAWGILRFGLAVSATSLLWFVYSSADMGIVSMVLGPVLLGYYTMSFQLVMMPIDKVSAIVNQVSFATYCKLQNDRPRLLDWFSRLMVLRCVATFPAVTGIALVANDAIPLLLGEKWRPVCFLVQLIAPVAAVSIVSTSFAPVFNAMSRPDISLRWAMANTVVLPIAFWIGCKAGGLTGVCLAWLICLPISSGLLIELTQHITGITLRGILRKLTPILGALACMISVVLLVQLALPGDNLTLIRLCTSILLGAGAYLGWIWMFASGTVVADVRILLRELRSS